MAKTTINNTLLYTLIITNLILLIIVISLSVMVYKYSRRMYIVTKTIENVADSVTETADRKAHV